MSRATDLSQGGVVARLELQPGEAVEVFTRSPRQDPASTGFAPPSRIAADRPPPALVSRWEQDAEEDWQKREIAALTREANDLKQRKEALESQIRNAEDANASIQSSWSALSRVSTTMASGRSGLKFGEGDADQSSWLDERQQLVDQVTELEALHQRLRTETTAAKKEKVAPPTYGSHGTEVLAASQASLLDETQLLALRIHEEKAALAAAEQHRANLSAKLSETEHQVSELTEPLADLQGVKAATWARQQSLEALEHSAERADRALANLSCDRASLLQAAHQLQEELRELQSEVLPRSADQHRQARHEAQSAREALGAAQERWHAEVQRCHSLQDSSEKKLASLRAREESSRLTAKQGRETCARLTRAVGEARASHGRLMRWQHSADSPTDQQEALESDPFGLHAKASALRNQCLISQAERDNLEQCLEAGEAKLEQLRIEAARQAEQQRLAAEVARQEQVALRACEEQLQAMLSEMKLRAEQLSGQLQGEQNRTDSLRRELAAAWEAGMGTRAWMESEPMQRFEHAPLEHEAAAAGRRSQQRPREKSVSRARSAAGSSGSRKKAAAPLQPLQPITAPTVSVRVRRVSRGGENKDPTPNTRQLARSPSKPRPLLPKK
eukprot:TRINITY_DN8181_c0_g1_i1.p1 TRINITY_DN8181_c0_g1~~TRINITY_DN8181_c0_g1_i1.p1  ORF type:complete len:618 (+),score=141.14 TRINITY_DN8181_c0_g1_i1:123-1976(+)